jgi:hypothetical protein
MFDQKLPAVSLLLPCAASLPLRARLRIRALLVETPLLEDALPRHAPADKPVSDSLLDFVRPSSPIASDQLGTW